MKIYILKTARFLKEDLIAFGNQADLRKASRNMRMAYAVVKKIISEFRENLAVVLGTGHGELETTRDFFKFYRQQNTARPILFQNSLHNSTIGFLSQTFKITGPAITQSDSCFSGEKALETAFELLKEKQASFCLVIGLDALVKGLEEVLCLLYPDHVHLGEGCGAMLLTNEDGLQLQHEKPIMILQDIQYEKQISGKASRLGTLRNYYDADAIEKIVLELEQNKPPENLVLFKPDGCCSRIKFMKEVGG